VETSTGKLLFCEEPKEHGLKETKHEYYECEDDNADVFDTAPKKSKHAVAPLLMKGVAVD
jgi:hypothetical protein